MQHLFNNIVILCKPKAQTQNLVRSPNGGFIPPEGSGKWSVRYLRRAKHLPCAKSDSLTAVPHLDEFKRFGVGLSYHSPLL